MCAPESGLCDVSDVSLCGTGSLLSGCARVKQRFGSAGQREVAVYTRPTVCEAGRGRGPGWIWCVGISVCDLLRERRFV